MSRSASRLPDWLFGAPVKRRLLTAVVDEANGGQIWSERELARELEVGIRGSIDEHLRVLAQLGLLRQEGPPPRYVVLRTTDLSPNARRLQKALRQLTGAVDNLPDDPLNR
jgi:hypothetical protein